ARAGLHGRRLRCERHPHSLGRHHPPPPSPVMNTIALIGSDSLLGREVRDIVSTAAATFHLRLVADTGEQPGALTRIGDEPTVVGTLDAASLIDAHAIFLAGSAESSRKALDQI